MDIKVRISSKEQYVRKWAALFWFGKGIANGHIWKWKRTCVSHKVKEIYWPAHGLFVPQECRWSMELTAEQLSPFIIVAAMTANHNQGLTTSTVSSAIHQWWPSMFSVHNLKTNVSGNCVLSHEFKSQSIQCMSTAVTFKNSLFCHKLYLCVRMILRINMDYTRKQN